MKIFSSLKVWFQNKWQRRRFRWLSYASLAMLIIYLCCLPSKLFQDPYSTVLEDRNGLLLGARIAADGQWRFPPMDSVPRKFAASIIAFEDKRFYSHLGVDPLATARALRLNLSQSRVVSGGSTLSMQVIRMSRKGKGRTIPEKILEMILATRLEWRYDKAEILNLYASHAPFGGNVVGLDAAAWKYFGRSADKLSWSEAATLAVLPNAPSLIHPGRNRDALERKRNFLLDKLYQNQTIDSLTCALAKLEPLPQKPKPLPSFAPHLLEKVHQKHLAEKPERTILATTLHRETQRQVNEIVKQHYYSLRQNEIHNAAVLVLEVETGDVLAYVGNTPCQTEDQACAVDVIPSRRSTGSILKPFLYASMINEGELLPDMLVPDVPSYYAGYNPTNYNRTYQGAVPASRALARSLNIPAVRMLSKYGVPRFRHNLQRLGLTTIDRPAADYGLTLVLGGAEASLWDLAGTYGSMARTLNDHLYYGGKYDPKAFHAPNYQIQQSQGRLNPDQFDQLREQGTLDAAAIYHTFEAMVEVTRPENEEFWQAFSSSRKIAWKTGTSYGFRDAWAIGCTPEYVVAVWVGNADGEGRPGLIGTRAAAPILFDVFASLGGANTWFEPPIDEMEFIKVCRHTGHRASKICPDIDTTWVPQKGLRIEPCPYHEKVFLDQSGTFQVSSECESPLNMQQASFLVLPPNMETYYRQAHPDFVPIPAFRSDCLAHQPPQKQMAIIYPRNGTKIYLPRELDGTLSSVVFEAAHRDPATLIYWHLDDKYLGDTKELHEMELQPEAGWHTLSLVDENGQRISCRFEILARED
ncbi:MAG: penicillin-binding protein 1C [Bacteroidota bacterium]